MTTYLQNDNDLALQARLGSDKAFEELVRRHFGLVYSLAYARLRSQEAAEDLAQEVFLRVYLNLPHYNPAFHFTSWISRIARNLAVDWWRKQQRQSRLLSKVPYDESEYAVADPTVAHPQERIDEEQRQKIIDRAIQVLSPAQREIVLLYFIANLKKTEIAERLEIHPASVAREMDRALVKIRRVARPMLEADRPYLPVRHASLARALTVTAALHTMLSGSKSVLAAEATLELLAEPVDLYALHGSVFSRLTDAVRELLLIPLKALILLLGGPAILTYTLKFVLPVLLLGGLLAALLKLGPAPRVTPVAAQRDDTVEAPVSAPPATRRNPGAAGKPSNRNVAAQRQNPSAPPPGTQSAAPNTSMQLEFQHAARRAQCTITSLRIQGAQATISLEAPSHVNLGDFLEELRLRGYLRNFEVTRQIGAHLTDGRRVYSITYQISF